MEEFNIQMKRLKDVWANAWPEEKVKLIWIAVNQHESYWFEKLVSDFLANNRLAPLPQEFMSAAHEQDKKRYLSKAFFAEKQEPLENSIFSKEEQAELFDTLKKAARGEINTKEADKYAKMVQGIIDERMPNLCKKCDNGLILKRDERGYEYVWKCDCDLGNRRPENFPLEKRI